MSDSDPQYIIKPGEGKKVDIGGLGVDFKVWGKATKDVISIVEHPMEPGRLTPPHMHHAEDELSYVLQGTFGVRIGDVIAEAGPGCYVFKPRDVPHAFWNPGPAPARLIEIITPAGFELFFEALGALSAKASTGAITPEEFEAKRGELAAQYHVDFVPDWADELKARFNLKLLGEP
ncbi:MAG: cupin domain-containing protein [Chloroflexota bacterium]|nr:cupin domain-containing protein [Chloroflexota bacterium]